MTKLEPRLCTGCGKSYLKPCDGKAAGCPNLEVAIGRATAKDEAEKGKPRKRKSGYRPGHDILTR